MVVWKVKVWEFYFIVFNCLAKALMRHMNNVGETSRASFVLPTTYKTLFSNQSRNHTTGCLDINCCPCNNSLFEPYTFCCHTTLEAPTVFTDNVSALQIYLSLSPTFSHTQAQVPPSKSKVSLFICTWKSFVLLRTWIVDAWLGSHSQKCRRLNRALAGRSR